jgi:hypothetical protein
MNSSLRELDLERRALATIARHGRARLPWRIVPSAR